MRKTFCDKCDKEILAGNVIPTQELRIQLPLDGRPDYVIGITVKATNGSTMVDLCKYCVLDAVAQWDDRPNCGQDYRRLHEILNDTESSVGTRAELIQALRNEFL